MRFTVSFGNFPKLVFILYWTVHKNLRSDRRPNSIRCPLVSPSSLYKSFISVIKSVTYYNPFGLTIVISTTLKIWLVVPNDHLTNNHLFHRLHTLFLSTVSTEVEKTELVDLPISTVVNSTLSHIFPIQTLYQSLFKPIQFKLYR